MFRIKLFFNIIQYLVVFLLSLNLLSAQYTEDCGINYGCLRLPTNCRNQDCMYIVKWNQANTYTNFIVTSYINQTSVFDAWTALGFSHDRNKGNDSVVMCRLSSYAADGRIETYYNSPNGQSDVFDTSNPSVGLFDQKIEVYGNFIICRFSRQHSLVNRPNYFDLKSPNRYNILISSGRSNYLGNPIFNGPEYRFQSYEYKQDFQYLFLQGAQPTTAPITTTINYTHPETSSKKKAHSCVMIFAWIFFASTGILLPHYYKYLFKPHNCGKHSVWFVLHVPCMLMVAILNLIGLLVILADQDWKWIHSDNELEFGHSILGIISMCLIYLQLFIGLLHPKKESSLRSTYRFIHGFIGYSTLIIAIVTMFLGTLISKMNLDRLGWCILAGWVIWFVILILVIEIIKMTKYGGDYKSYPYKLSGSLKDNHETLSNFKKKFHQIKGGLLLLHLLISFGFALTMVIIIGLTDDYYW